MCRMLAASVPLAAVLWGPAIAQGKNDRHAGYYYPPPASVEIYKARAKTMKTATRTIRIGFIVNLVSFMRERPYAPRFSIFPKGERAQKLIIVADQVGRLDTIYRVRAMLATMTSLARKTPVFRQRKVETIYTYLDLLMMLGFERITISDGDRFAHQIRLE